jgi:Na+/melibiose symporter-like transporter
MTLHPQKRARLLAAGLFLAAYFALLVATFPLIVIALGFRLSEGWAFLMNEPSFSVVFGFLPFLCIAMSWMVEFKHRVSRRQRK